MKQSDIPPEITVEQIAGVIKASRKRREMLFIACACVGPAGYCACEQQYDREDAQAVMDFLEKAKGADSFGLTDVRDSGE
jgi:hypothetical protein